MSELITLVDMDDNEIGCMDKLEAHRKGILHRAFSIFILNRKNQMLLQRRAVNKYHSGGLWTNTCCSHQRLGERLEEAAHRRLMEEMGFDCVLKDVFSFIYKAHLDNSLVEHELDHVFLGYFDGEPQINIEEADAWEWVDIEEIQKEISYNPSKFTYWFLEAFPQVVEHIKDSL